MQKRIRREAELPSFHLNLDELQVLVERLKSFVNKEAKLEAEVRVVVNLSDGELSFENVDEMRANEDLPKRLSKFLVETTCAHAQIRLDSRYGESAPGVFVTGESVGWCAATIEEVRAFVHRKRAWYWWFRGTPLGALVFLPLFAPAILEKLWGVPVINNAGVGAGILVALGLYASRARVFPNAVVDVRVEENWFRRYSAELALVVALLGLVTSVVQAFVK